MVPQAPPFPALEACDVILPTTAFFYTFAIDDLIFDILRYAIAVNYSDIEACSEDCVCSRTAYYKSIRFTVVLKCRTMLPNSLHLSSHIDHIS